MGPRALAIGATSLVAALVIGCGESSSASAVDTAGTSTTSVGNPSDSGSTSSAAPTGNDTAVAGGPGGGATSGVGTAPSTGPTTTSTSLPSSSDNGGSNSTPPTAPDSAEPSGSQSPTMSQPSATATGTGGSAGGGGAPPATAGAGGGLGAGGSVGNPATCSAESNDAVDPPGNPEVQRTVDPGQRFQTTEGWGTSLCWFGNVVGGWSDDRRNAVADLLFDDEQGLGLNVIRYNIGGGEAPDHNHMGYGKEMPGFKPTEGGDYDFDADANQRWMLDAAIARIDASDIILEAFSNSPPWWMTNSGCASGAQGGTNNLKSEYVDDFADYLTEVVLHFRDSWGISFRTLEPMNEPMVGWSYNGGQEGCHIERPDQPTLLHEVRSQLDEKGLSEVQLAAPDETALDETVTSYNSYDNATRDLVSQINTHAYYGSQRSQLRDLADRDGKRLWSSEIDGSGAPAPFDVYPHNHEDIVPGLDIAQRITRDLREMHVDAWIFWQAVESEQAQTNLNKNWGLLHGDFENNSEQTYLTKKYYTMKQYSGFIRPGFVMISVDDADAVAFVSEELGRLVIVQRRAENSDSVYSYDLSGFAAVGGHTAVYRTSASENFERLSDIAIAGSSLTVPVKGQSITTFVVDCVDP